MRLSIWSPLPPSPSGIADYVAESLPALVRRFDVEVVVEAPERVLVAPGVRLVRPAEATGDLHLYHVGNSPAHAYVYRAALARPGVLVLHEWSIHHLVLGETVERGDVSAYLREMRHAHGEAGSLIGRQVARALGGEMLPALYPVNDRLLERSLAVVGLTRYVSERAARRLPDRPVLHLPHHLSLPWSEPPTRAEARARLGLDPDALVVTAPGLATRAKRLEAALPALGRLRAAHPRLTVVVAGEVQEGLPLGEWVEASGLTGRTRVTGRLDLPSFALHLAAADVVLALRFPSHGEISGALVRALGTGAVALVTAGTPASDEFPEGVVVPVDPGRGERAALEATLLRLLGDAPLRGRISRLARAHALRHHGLAEVTGRLAAFLEQVAARRDELLARERAGREEEGSLLELLVDEVRWTAQDLGLPGAAGDVRPLLAELVRR